MYYQSNQNKSPASHFLVGEGNNEQLTVPESSLCAFDRTSGSLTHASEQHGPMWKCNNKWNSKNCLREGHRNSCPSTETQLFWSPVFLARSFTHLLTLLISSSWCRTWHAGTWSWYIMHDCYPRGYVTDEQTNMTVFNTIKIPARPSVRCKDRRQMVQHLHGNIAHYLFCPDIHGGSIFLKFFVIGRNRTGRRECKLNKSWAPL